jgi:nitrate/TMAO reductase-like tetraheme cytochrome c subunit
MTATVTHTIGRSVDRSSPINHANVAATCGKCHVGIEKTYNASIHGQILAKGAKNGPVCVDCHSAHEIAAPDGINFKAASDEKCGSCHKDRLEHYRDTYHGKAMLLGRPNLAPEVAACYDCHGYHDVLPQSDPASHLSKANIVATCQKCHAGRHTPISPNTFPHANPLDATHYPAVALHLRGDDVACSSAPSLFFGAHTMRCGSFVPATSVGARLENLPRSPKIETQKGDEWFTRAFLPLSGFSISWW